MARVKSFTTEIKVFHVMQEISELDEHVNQFIVEKGIKKVISVSDACTTDDTGKTIGIIRALAYEES